MRFAKGWVVVGLLTLAAPAGAIGPGGARGAISGGAGDAISVSVAPGAASWFERLLQSLLSMWGATRGVIVPGDGTTSSVTTTSGGG